MPHYNEAEFRRRVNTALARLRTLLDHTRHPQIPDDVPHGYDDKYQLVEFLTRTSMGGVLTCLEAVGLTLEGLGQLREWAKTRSVTLRLDAREDCTFLRETTREVVSPRQHVTEIKSSRGDETTIRDKVVTTVTEYWWNFEFHYRVFAFQGTEVDEGITLCERRGTIELKTATQTPPRPQTTVRPARDANVTWILQHVDAHSRLSFAIDRMDARCHTPRRNPSVEGGLRAFREFSAWCAAVDLYFRSELFPVQQGSSQGDLDLSAIATTGLFSPVIALFEGDGRGGAADPDAGGLLPVGYVNTFLEEQLRSLTVKRQNLAKAFPQDSSVITAQEVCLLVTLIHAREVCKDFASGVDYVEDMLRKQIIAAIGKVVTPADFADYMSFHYRKLYKPEFRPQPFSYAVRRPEHDPEGTLSLEVRRPEATPISTLVQRREASRAMKFPLDAATQVSFFGDRYLHAWVGHQFSSSSESLTLVARARQFSSFILLVGRIASADAFEPRHAIIVQNKDVLEIPLLLEQIPTPKEFRDAIESLSPEQQRFAKAFRGMQLESTLFGICVVQIKPQLEKLLKLPPDSLTKEIKLTQDLLELFMEYQIPSDLLSYDGTSAEATTEDKLARVREYVSRMQALIQEAKQKELDEAQQREAFRRAEANRTLALDPFGPGDALGGADPFGAGAVASSSFGGDPFGAPPPSSTGFAPPPSAPFGAAPPPRASLGADPFAASPPPPSIASPEVPQAATPPSETRPEATGGGDRPKSTVAPAGDPEGGGGVDYTQIPGILDRRLEQLDEDSAVRPTIINPGDLWSKSFRKSLLADVAEKSLHSDEQRTEKDKAFDLIDALSKSGDLPLEHVSLHVVIAATHCFDKTLLETVVQGNVNPVEKVERSSMIVATTVHGKPATELLVEDQRQRFFATSPQLNAAPEGLSLPPSRS